MTSKAHGRRIIFDVRTKLLLMLAVLSLPLLVVSLAQLASYQRSLNEQSQSLARIEAVAAAGALQEWAEKHGDLVARDAPLAPEAARDLYEHLRRHVPSGAASSLNVLDRSGRVVADPSAGGALLAPRAAAAGAAALRWQDGVLRVTSAQRVEPSGWGVVVGVPPPEDTPAGRSAILLTATWALALLASTLIGVWAVGRFTKPLRELAASASTLGGGQLRERVRVETDDEVGTLADSFNEMAASLQNKFRELRAQGAFIEEVLDSLPLGVAVLDERLAVSRANKTFAEIVGRGESQLAGRGLYEAAAGLAALSEVVEDVRRTRRPFVNYGLPLELNARDRRQQPPGARGEGRKFWDVILWPTTERGVGRADLIVILAEVSKRVRAEKLATDAFAAEKARAAELESVINQMTEGVIIVDARGRYRVNPSAARILGRQPGEFRDGVRALIEDMALCDLRRNRLAPEETPLGRALERGERLAGEHMMIERGGEERVLEISATPLVAEGAGGAGGGAVAVFHDVTEEVRRHAEVVEAYDRLREHDRLKSAFVANVSHELRTPLNVIIGLCQLLGRDPQLPLAPAQAESVVRMERNARNLLELVNHLLEYSRLEAGRAALRLEHVNVAEVVSGVASEYAEFARGRGIELRVEVSDALGPVWTDRHKLAQVLSSLVSNAVKFTSSGAVAVAAGPESEERWYVEVSDTGIGMSSDALEYIFDSFRQVDERLARSYSGVGLGLAITRKIVELLGGEIEVESKQNEGSRFRVTWPRAARQRTGTGSLVGEGKPSLVVGERNARAQAG